MSRAKLRLVSAAKAQKASAVAAALEHHNANIAGGASPSEQNADRATAAAGASEEAVPASTPSPANVDTVTPASRAQPRSSRRPAGPAASGATRPVSRSALAELPDEGLVALARSGETRAAEQLYRRHAPFAINLATRIAGSTNDVEDVVHDAFIKAFDNLGSLRTPKAFRGWLGSIVVYAMRSRLRRGRFMRLFGLGRGGDPIDIEHLASDSASPRARAELAQVYALLRTLAVDDRIAWTLRVVEGHELKTAAELAGCSLATIKRRIGRAQRYIDQHFVAADAENDASTAAQTEVSTPNRPAGSDRQGQHSS